MSKMGNEEFFNGLMSTATAPAQKLPKSAEEAPIVEQSQENPPKRRRKKTTTTEDNLKRQTFWADQTQWQWIQDYAYTTRQSVMDTMYQIIEDFQSHCDIEVEPKPRRRKSKK